MKKIQELKTELGIAIAMFFRQCAQYFTVNPDTSVFLGGNVDPFYILFPVSVYKMIKDKKMKILLYLLLGGVSFIGIQYLVNGDYQIIKGLISLSKILMCIIIAYYGFKYINQVNIRTIVLIYTVLIGISLLVALTFGRSSFLWRFNDGVNLYNLTRLQLLYLEPSELGYHLSIVIILIFSIILIEKKISKFTAVTLVVNLITLYLAKPMGAIMFTALSVFLMLAYFVFLNPNRTNKAIFVGIMILGLSIITIMYFMKSPIIMRVIATLSGTDGSNNYRIGVSFNVLRQSLIDYRGLGAGIGMINTPEFIDKYHYLRLTTVVVNSFIYFMIEAGILGIISVVILIYLLVKEAIKSKSILALGLVVFIVGYQFMGSHFTSGMNWLIYGLILNKNIEVLY